MQGFTFKRKVVSGVLNVAEKSDTTRGGNLLDFIMNRI